MTINRGSRRRQLFLGGLVCVLTVAALGFVRARTNQPVASSGKAPGVVSLTATQDRKLLALTQSATAIKPARLPGNTTDDGIEAELFTILPSGCEPTELRRPEGKFILAIDNRSGLAEVNLTLTRLSNGRLQHQSRLRKGILDLREVVDLKPGVYRLSEANNPNWEARLTITEK